MAGAFGRGAGDRTVGVYGRRKNQGYEAVSTSERQRIQYLSSIIQVFADLRLQAPENVEKGDDWAECVWDYLRLRTHEEVDELFDRLEAGTDTYEECVHAFEEAGDVENFMRMALDKAGLFTNRMRAVRSGEADNGRR